MKSAGHERSYQAKKRHQLRGQRWARPLSMGVFAAAVIAAAPAAQSAPYYWDADGATSAATGGAGVWDAGSPLWRLNDPVGGGLNPWPNTSPNADTANFAGTAGTVTLNSSSVDINVNQIVFGTTGYTIAAPAAGTAGLVFSGATPTIDTGANAATIGALMSGSVSKTGAGTLTVTNTGNAGSFTVSAGTLRGGGTTANTNGGFGTGAIELQNGAILSSAMGSNNTLSFPIALTINTGQTGTFNTPNRVSWSGSITGGGTLNVGVTTTVSRLDLNNNLTGFTGTLNFTGTGGVRLVNNGGTFNTSSFQNLTLDLAGSVNLQPLTNSGGNTYPIGSLSGSSATAALGGGSAGRATYSVGALNASTTYAGQILGNSALTKTGTGTLTLSGASTYTGVTTITGGSIIAAADSALGTGNVTVQSTAIKLTLSAAVTNAIGDTATLSLAGGGTPGVADVGYVQLNGNVETVGALTLGGTAQPLGVYTALTSPEYISGPGSINVVPEPAALSLVALGVVGLLARRRRR